MADFHIYILLLKAYFSVLYSPFRNVRNQNNYFAGKCDFIVDKAGFQAYNSGCLFDKAFHLLYKYRRALGVNLK
jgi:hypothetical protein